MARQSNDSVSTSWGFVDDSVLNYMVDKISDGQCILFVGAGLTQTCSDASGNKGPNAAELAQLLTTRFLGHNEMQTNLALAASAPATIFSVMAENWL